MVVLRGFKSGLRKISFLYAQTGNKNIAHKNRKNPDKIRVFLWLYLFCSPFLVEATGFEPAALCSQSRCATKLRHASILYCDLKVALVALLRFPKFPCALERHRNFDRCAILALLHRPPDALRRWCPKQMRYQTAPRLDIILLLWYYISIPFFCQPLFGFGVYCSALINRKVKAFWRGMIEVMIKSK